MAVFWKLKSLGYYGRGGLGLGLELGLGLGLGLGLRLGLGLGLRLGLGLGLRLGLGLGIYKFTEGYLYFRKYRHAGYAILRDTHISVTPE